MASRLAGLIITFISTKATCETFYCFLLAIQTNQTAVLKWTFVFVGLKIRMGNTFSLCEGMIVIAP